MSNERLGKKIHYGLFFLIFPLAILSGFNELYLKLAFILIGINFLSRAITEFHLKKKSDKIWLIVGGCFLILFNCFRIIF